MNTDQKTIVIAGIQDVSTIDYPKEAVSVVFVCGCPFRCPYCHNWTFFDPKNCREVSIRNITETLQRYSVFTTGITITGGEPTYQASALIELLKRVRQFGKIKLDTNGSYPRVIARILDLELVDYIAMDVKAPLEPRFYERVVGGTKSGEEIVRRVKESYDLIVNKKDVVLEIRITVVPTLMFEKSDIIKISKEVKDADIITLQQFNPSKGTLDPSLVRVLSPPRAYLLELASAISPLVRQVQIRTIEQGEEIIKTRNRLS